MEPEQPVNFGIFISILGGAILAICLTIYMGTNADYEPETAAALLNFIVGSVGLIAIGVIIHFGMHVLYELRRISYWQRTGAAKAAKNPAGTKPQRASAEKPDK